MNDIDAPNTKPGYCPVCSLQANIWDVMKSHWCCNYCNWTGAFPDKEPKLKTIYGAKNNGND